MLKKDITYPDLDGNMVTETFWFNLNEAEMAEMAIGKEGKQGGFDVWVRTLIDSQDGETLVETFKKILLSTIGERSADNRRFIKSKEIQDNFLFSNAYSQLFMELMSDAKKMSDFVNGVVPANMREQLGKMIENGQDGSPQMPHLPTPATPPVPVSERGLTTPAQPEDDRPEWMKDPNRIPTTAELRGATHDQMLEAFRRQAHGTGAVTQEQAPDPQ